MCRARLLGADADLAITSGRSARTADHGRPSKGDAYPLGRRASARYAAGEAVVSKRHRVGPDVCSAHHPRPYVERL